VFDLSPTKLLILAVIALVVFGPNELPKIAQQAGRMIRDLRRIAEGAKADLREGLGPEFQDFDFDDLNPRRFVQKHLLDDPAEQARQPYDDAPALPDAMVASNGLANAGLAGTALANTGLANPGLANAGAAASQNGARATLLDGEDPPYDVEAT
jgi:sec-independent protein translocase protein TatB